jgi:hypothetical protein
MSRAAAGCASVGENIRSSMHLQLAEDYRDEDVLVRQTTLSRTDSTISVTLWLLPADHLHAMNPCCGTDFGLWTAYLPTAS